MKVRLISHASVVVRSSDCGVLCDPWLFGKAFNDSWSLFPKAAWDERWLDDTGFLWISHEHPDHFHFPSLRSLPEAWKNRVVVLYQKRDGAEILSALKSLGFRRFRLLPHRKPTQISERTQVYCYHARYGDSCLAIIDGNSTILNVNDAQIDESDCDVIRSDLGAPDVMLKQFSLAGYTGGPDYERELPEMAGSILTHLVDLHRWLESGTTIPFASFVYFSNRDNYFVNRFANTPRDALACLEDASCNAALLYPGDQFQVGIPFDSTTSSARFERDYSEFSLLPIDQPEVVPLPKLQEAFASFCFDIRSKFTRRRVDRLPPVLIRVPDLHGTLAMSIATGTIEQAEDDPQGVHLEACSQALHFAFSAPFGFETLSISSRMIVHNDRDWPWILNRDLLWLYRWGIWLKPRWMLSPKASRRILRWFRENKLHRGAIREWLHRPVGSMKRVIAKLYS